MSKERKKWEGRDARNMTNDEISNVKRWFAKGKSWSTIGKSLNISRATLEKRGREGIFGEEIRQQLLQGERICQKRTRTMTDEETSKVKRWFAEGKSWITIARLLDIPPSTLNSKRRKGVFGEKIRQSLEQGRPIVRDMTDEEISNVKRWFAEGESWLEMARRLKMNPTTFKDKRRKGEFGDNIRRERLLAKCQLPNIE
jgi:DNA-binding CsgD family transcriptional regulator